MRDSWEDQTIWKDFMYEERVLGGTRHVWVAPWVSKHPKLRSVGRFVWLQQGTGFDGVDTRGNHVATNKRIVNL